MTAKQSPVSLDSFRLAQYSVGVPCYICEGTNNFDADLCRHCLAPMALARQARDPKHQPRLIGVLGAADAGKTVYLGMLTDMLSRREGQLRLLARGAFSVSLQQTTMAALSACEFPDKTPNEPDRWNWIHCQAKVASRRRPWELIVPDVAGESLHEEIDHPGAYPILRAFLAKCSAALVLIDLARLGSGEQDQDFLAMKIVSYLAELHGSTAARGKNGNRRRERTADAGWSSRPLGLVFTKADRCVECLHDPPTYAQRHTPGLWQLCRERLPRHQFFATTVAGACAREADFHGPREFPLRIEPRGVIEPFAWLVDQLGQGKTS